MQHDYKDLTNKIKSASLEAISSIAYETWIAPIEIYSIEDNVVTFIVPTTFFGNQLKPYEQLLKNCFKKVVHKEYEINYISEDTLKKENNSSVQLPYTEQIKSNLDPRYTFNNFVIIYQVHQSQFDILSFSL